MRFSILIIFIICFTKIITICLVTWCDSQPIEYFSRASISDCACINILQFIEKRKAGETIKQIEHAEWWIKFKLCKVYWVDLAPAKRFSSRFVGARSSGSGRAHRSLAAGFLLLQHFSYFLLSSPHYCFISVLVWIFMFSEMLHWWIRNPSRGLNKGLVYTTAELRARVVAI